LRDIKLLSNKNSILGSNGLSVGDFWQWAYSDILSNRNRAIFAEFLVASALNQIDHSRIEWDAVDIYYEGAKIEVKSAAYLQSWKQNKLSQIKFDIAKKKSWYAETNTYSEEATRSSDIYVFCLFSEKDKNKADVLNLNQWQFYIVPTQILNDVIGDAKSISLKRLEKLGQVVSYDQLKLTIDGCLRT
jgi:hypothetical protein